MSLRTFSLTMALLGGISHAVADCPADLDGDGRVDSADMGIVLASWGSDSSIADLDGDGEVTGADLATILGYWGDCPDAPTCTASDVLGYESYVGDEDSGVHAPATIDYETSTGIDCDAPALFAGILDHCTVDFVYYPVSGANLSEICTAIFDPTTGAGPADGDGRHAGYTAGRFQVVVGCIELPIEQDIPTAHPWWTTLRGTITITLPEWTDLATAPEADAMAWLDWMIELQNHELEHAAIFDEMIGDMLTRHGCTHEGLPWCLPMEIPMPAPSIGDCVIGSDTMSAAAIEVSETVAEWLFTSSDYTNMMNRQRALDATTDHGPSLDCSGGEGGGE